MKKSEFIKESKNKPCADCGKSFPFYVMEYDHLPQFKKNFTISQSKSFSMRQVRQEMAKCDLVCANCHRTRTWKRSHNLPVKGSVALPERAELSRDGEPVLRRADSYVGRLLSK